MQKINYATVSLQDIYAYRYLGKSFYGDSLVFVKILAQSASKAAVSEIEFHSALLQVKLDDATWKKADYDQSTLNTLRLIGTEYGVFTCRGPMTGLLLIADNTD